MSVCIFSPSDNIWGGGQIYIESLCNYMNLHDLPSLIATSEPETFSCRTLEIPAVSNKLERLLYAPVLARKLKKMNFKVVVLNDLSSLWLAPVFRIYGFKVVSLLHLYLQKRTAEGLGYGLLEYQILRASSLFCHRIFSVNKENLLKFPVKIKFVGNFISPWFFETQGTVQKAFDLGLIARLSPQKNIHLFVELIAKLNQISDRPINALIVGKGEEENSVRKSIELNSLNSLVELRPWAEREDLPEIYSKIRVFAITSFHEGFATTLLEAHAQGVPAITTRSAGYCAEFIESEPSPTGLVFSPADVQDEVFLRKVLFLLNHSCDYSDYCKEKARFYSEELVLGKITEGISELMLDKVN